MHTVHAIRCGACSATCLEQLSQCKCPALRPAGNYIVQTALNPPPPQPAELVALPTISCAALLRHFYEHCFGHIQISSSDCLFLIADHHALVLHHCSNYLVARYCKRVFEDNSFHQN